MPTTAPQYLYMIDEDLYRFGNATTSKLDNVRLHRNEVNTYDRNGVLMVRSDGKGISLITESRLASLIASGDMQGSYVWKIPPRFPIHPGLALFPDTDRLKPGQLPEHYFLCPQSDMPLSEYVGLLAKMALNFERIQRV